MSKTYRAPKLKRREPKPVEDWSEEDWLREQENEQALSDEEESVLLDRARLND